MLQFGMNIHSQLQPPGHTLLKKPTRTSSRKMTGADAITGWVSPFGYVGEAGLRRCASRRRQERDDTTAFNLMTSEERYISWEEGEHQL